MCIYIYTFIHHKAYIFLDHRWACRTSETKVLATVSPLMMVCTSAVALGPHGQDVREVSDLEKRPGVVLMGF